MSMKGARMFRSFVAASLLAIVGQVAQLAFAQNTNTRFLLLERFSQGASFQLTNARVDVWEPVELGKGALVTLSGVLDRETAAVLSELVQRKRVAYLSLASPGGLVDPTLALGQHVRRRRVTTIVEGGAECYSACALLFLAGVERVLGEFKKTDLRQRKTPASVGFHASYVVLPDGSRQHLQDVGTSKVCAYLRIMVPRSASELCAYTLATKGIATFSYELGRSLDVYTAAESDLELAQASAALETAGESERHWVACERYLSRLLAAKGQTLDSFQAASWPCRSTRISREPMNASRRILLKRVSFVLGPADLPTEVRELALEEAASKLERIGLTSEDEYFIACERAGMYISEKFPLASRDPDAGEHSRIWGRNCFYRSINVDTRAAFGVGVVFREAISDTLTYIARKRGAAWFPADFAIRPPEAPLPREFQ